VIERELQVRTAGTNQFLNLDTQKLLTPPPEVADALADQANEPDSRVWQGLDIPEDSEHFQYINWLRESGADLMFAGNGKLIGFDGLFPIAHGDSQENMDDWDALTPQEVRAAVEMVDWERHVREARVRGEPLPPATAAGVDYRSAMQLDSRESGGPVVNLLTRDQSTNWFFKTREGNMGVMQLIRFNTNPATATIRYKLIQPVTNNTGAALGGTGKGTVLGMLLQRMEAASKMNDGEGKDGPLAIAAAKAARAGQVERVKETLDQILDTTLRVEATREAAVLLARQGMKKQAIDMAREISDDAVRNRALSELTM
jgi:hypothetical protein